MPGQTSPVTPRQLEVLRKIDTFQSSRCYSATMGELAQQLGVSRPTVFEHVGELQRKGLLDRSPGRARSLRLTPRGSRLLEEVRRREVAIEPESPTAEGIPLLGRVAAGVPVEAIETPETISLKDLFGQASGTFALQVMGESMIEEGIRSGDYVICRKAASARNGQLVVAIVDSDQATLKRFYREGDHVRLQPANAAYEPIRTQDCRIEAVVVGVLRRL